MLAAGCGGKDEAAPTEVVLVTHDSFAISKEVRQRFERESGLRLRILQAGDANETLNRALLTAGDPQGDVIFGIDAAQSLPGVHVIQAGTALRDGELVTAGGRVLAVVGTGPEVDVARSAAYAGVALISFDGAQHRTDIALDR